MEKGIRLSVGNLLRIVQSECLRALRKPGSLYARTRPPHDSGQQRVSAVLRMNTSTAPSPHTAVLRHPPTIRSSAPQTPSTCGLPHHDTSPKSGDFRHVVRAPHRRTPRATEYSRSLDGGHQISTTHPVTLPSSHPHAFGPPAPRHSSADMWNTT